MSNCQSSAIAQDVILHNCTKVRTCSQPIWGLYPIHFHVWESYMSSSADRYEGFFSWIPCFFARQLSLPQEAKKIFNYII